MDINKVVPFNEDANTSGRQLKLESVNEEQLDSTQRALVSQSNPVQGLEQSAHSDSMN